jgi:hypothetical protein
MGNSFLYNMLCILWSKVLCFIVHQQFFLLTDILVTFFIPSHESVVKYQCLNIGLYTERKNSSESAETR